MTRALSARTAELAGKRTLRAVPLVTITTYSDRDAGTVDTVHRFSDRGLRWDGEQWLPYLQRIEPQTMTMAHIPDAAGADGAFDRVARIVLRNAQLDDGTYLSEQLRSENLLFSRVTLAQLMLDDDESGPDLESIADTEAVAWFRGEVRQVEPMENGAELPLLIGSELPNVPFETLGDASTIAPKDRGKRVPIVYGYPYRVPALNASVGAITVSTVPLQSSGSVISVNDTSEFPTAGSGLINGEQIAWTGKTATTLTGVSRGSNPSVHSAGSVVAYVPATSKFIIGQAGCEFSRVYMRNLGNDQLVAMPSIFARDSADTSLTVDGGPVTSLAVTQFALRNAISDIVRAEMEQQPDFEFTSSDVDVRVIRPLGNHVVNNLGSDYTLATGLNGSSPLIKRDGGYSSGDNDGIDFVFDAVQADLNARIVNRYRLVARGTLTLPDGTGAFPPAYSGTVTIRSNTTTWPGAGGGTLSATWTQTYTNQPAGTFYDFEIVDSWITPPANTELSDFQSRIVQAYFSGNGNVEVVFDPTQTGVEFEIIGGGSITQTQLGRIAAAAGGVALDLYCDVSGPSVPSPQGDYIDATGTTIEKPADILRHFVTVYCGAPSSMIDTAALDAADTALGGAPSISTVLSDYGDTFAPIVGALAFQSRCNVVQAEGASSSVFRMLSPTYVGGSGLFEFPAAALTLSQWQSFDESGRDRDTIANRFRVLTMLDRAVQSGGEDAYRHAYVNGDAELSRVTTALVNASRARFGLRDHGGFFLPDIIDTGMVNEVAAYYSRQALDDHSVFTLRGVPWVDGYTLERGDVVSFALFYRASAIKARVIEVTKSWQTQLVDLVLVEVD